MLPALTLLVFLEASSAAEQEQQRIETLQWKVLDLSFRVTDLAGNLVDVGGRVEEMRVKETETEITIDLAADVLFDFDQAVVLPRAEATLQKAAEFVIERAKGVVRIEGHTDAKGDDEYNLRLSSKRAEAVRDWLLRHGASNMRFVIAGRGEKNPVAANQKPDGSDDPEGRQKNRRVQIVVSKR